MKICLPTEKQLGNKFYDCEIDTTEILKKISNKYPFKDRLDMDEDRDYFAFPLERQQYEIADELTKLQNEAFDEIVSDVR